MRRGGAGLIAAVLALAGCKSTADPKAPDRTPTGLAARSKDKAKEKDKEQPPTWLNPVAKMPGSDTAVPKSATWGGDPKSAGFNAKAEAQDAVGGKVVDSSGRPAKNIFIRVEGVNDPPGTAPKGIYTDDGGYFFTRGLKSGTAYNLTAEATRDGKQLNGTVQTRVPNPVLTIVLREDLNAAPSGALPPSARDDPLKSGGFPPPPVPSDSDHIPAMGLAPPAPPNPKTPADGAWSPGGAVKGSVPATIGGSPVPSPAPRPSAGGPLPEPDDLTAPPKPITRPENVAETPRTTWVPPVANIPPPVPTPKLPAPPPSAPEPRQSRGGRGTNFRLLDPLERPWEFAANRTGSLVLLEFVTSDCPNCRAAVPILKDVQSKYAADGVEVVAVLCDELPLKDRAAAAGKYATASNTNYKVFVETGAAPGSVRDAFGVEAYPRALLLDANGAVLWNDHPGRKADLDAAIRKALRK